MVVPMVMVRMVGLDHDGLSAGGAGEEQRRYTGEQKLLHLTFS
jgi:hypothetical protein